MGWPGRNNFPALSPTAQARYTGTAETCRPGNHVPVMSFVSSAAERITRKLGWSNSAEAWTDRLGLLFAFVVIGGWLTISFWSGRPAVILVVGAVGVATLALLERIGVIKLLGPVFWYDTIRSARRGRYFLMRWLYAIGLLLLLLWVHSIWSLQNRFVNNADPNWN